MAVLTLDRVDAELHLLRRKVYDRRTIDVMRTGLWRRIDQLLEERLRLMQAP
jgi:hypothetical protein